MQHVSESVFKGLCGIIGTSQQVAMRREVVDLMEIVREDKNQAFEMMSGSRREGFRLPGSDIDNMYCLYKHRVIWSLGQVQNYNVNKIALILADCSKSLPGFNLLELLTPTDRKSVDSACICINDRRYISSSLYRQITCSHIFPNSTEHGPCSTGNYTCTENMEYDNAHCISSNFWPPSASPWIKRCNIWPEGRVLKDIVRSGCHFVAIGHKLGNYEDKEWRISFSLAEQKLVYSMNHCQFLTYGLLKLFLKEVINNELSEDDKLLCSYHMKTAVFWVLQKNTMLDPTRAQTALNDLQLVVHLDQIVPPSAGNGDISWQILGNHYGAISSFLQSIGQEPLSKIQIATLMRIRDSLRVLKPDLFR
ncbi:uncharacterized protein LOC134264666 [Saccostrea cucullata]|uniref:uncharacterized protein LOC134264666 n=1 Tax=Saccostrea cuccullata TaxID=36930 RepID=UPI002ED0FA1D